MAVPPNTSTPATRFQHDICEGKIHPNNCPSNCTGPYSRGLYLEEAKPQRWMCWDAEGEIHEQMLRGRPAGIHLPVFVPSLQSPWCELMIFSYHWASPDELLPQPGNWVKTASGRLYTTAFAFPRGSYNCMLKPKHTWATKGFLQFQFRLERSTYLSSSLLESLCC